jgi:hypothetical protein
MTLGNEIRCGVCGKTFPWKEKFAGRKARCPCGAIMDYPKEPPAANAEEDLYDIAPDRPAAAAVTGKTDAVAATAAPATLRAAPVLGYRTASKNSVKPELDVDQLKNVTGPLWILGGGVVVEAGITLWTARSDLSAAMVHLLVDVGANTVLMMVGVLIAAKVRQFQIGSLGSALLRLAAISIAPAAVSDLFGPIMLLIPLGWILLLAVTFGLYFALLGMFFDLDESDTWLCVWIIFLIHLGLYFAQLYFLR